MTDDEHDPGRHTARAVTPLFHQTWRTRVLATHSHYATLSRRRIRRHHPGFSYWLWTDGAIDAFVSDYVRHQFPELHQTYRRLPQKIMRIDFVRYLWMYVFGGIYCDLDLIVRQPMSSLFVPDKAVYFIERAWTTDGLHVATSVHQAWLASAPQHPIWIDIMIAIGKLLDAGERDVLNLTGPNGVSRIISEQHLLERYADVQVLPSQHLYQPGWTKTPRRLAYCDHVTTATWKGNRLPSPVKVVVNSLRALRAD